MQTMYRGAHKKMAERREQGEMQKIYKRVGSSSASSANLVIITFPLVGNEADLTQSCASVEESHRLCGGVVYPHIVYTDVNH